MNRVIGARHSSLTRNLHIVAELFQQSHQQDSSRIIVKVKPHERMMRVRSCGDSSLGLPWYL